MIRSWRLWRLQLFIGLLIGGSQILDVGAVFSQSDGELTHPVEIAYWLTFAGFAIAPAAFVVANALHLRKLERSKGATLTKKGNGP